MRLGSGDNGDEGGGWRIGDEWLLDHIEDGC